MQNRVSALNEIVALAREHRISATEIRAAMREEAGADGASVSGRIFAFVGGIFILCGLGFFMEGFWNDMTSAARIVLSLGAGMVMLILALMLEQGRRFTPASTPLFLLAALFQSGGIMVAFDELGMGGDPRHALLAMALVMLAQMLLLFRVHRRTVLLFLALVFATAGLVDFLEIMAVDADLNQALSGAALLAVSFRLRQSSHAAILPFWYLVAGILMSFGVFEFVQETPLHLVYIGYAALLIWFSTVAHSRTLLFVGTCSMIGYLGYFTGEYFAGSLGWPFALMIIGLLFIGLSVLAIKIGREYISAAA